MLRLTLFLAALLTAVLPATAQAGFQINRSMEGVRIGMTREAVRERLGAPARRELGPTSSTGATAGRRWRSRSSRGSYTLFTRSAFVRGPRDIGVGTSERRLKRVVDGLRCESAEGQRFCFLGSFDTGRRSTVFVMRRRQVTSVTISLSTP